MSSKKILHVIGLISNSAGGPRTSILSLMKDKSMMEHQFDQYVLCQIERKDLSKQSDTLRKKMIVSPFRSGFAHGFYVLFYLSRFYKKNGRFIINLHGLFGGYVISSLFFSRVMGIELVVSLRGMAPSGLIVGRKASIKKLYLLVVSMILRKKFDFVLHVTSELERKAAEEWFPGARVKLMVNLSKINRDVKPHEFSDSSDRFDGRKNVVYLGRCSHKKNVHLLLDWWLCNCRKLRDRWVLTICGPVDSRFQRHLANIDEEKAGIRVLGPIENTEGIVSLFSSADLSVHPSYEENFGHSIYESLRLGIPSIVTVHCPWANLVSESKTGWVFRPSESEFYKAMDRLLVLDDKELLDMRVATVREANILRQTPPPSYPGLFCGIGQ